MGASPFQAAVDALLRPLEFAARAGAEASERVRDLEASVARACRRATALAVPPDVKRQLARLERDFSRPLDAESRTQKARKALAALEPWREPAWSDAQLARSVAELPGVGPRRAEILARRGLRSVGDLLFHLPVRYDDRRRLCRVGELEVGRRATFLAQVKSVQPHTARVKGGLRRILEAVVDDETGSIALKWFRAPPALEAVLRPGARILVTGDVKRYRFNKELVHPEVEPADAGEEEEAGDADLDAFRHVAPDYPALDGVPPRTLRRLIERALAAYADLVAGHLPESIARERGLPEAAEALRIVHAPDPDADVDAYRTFASPAHERLVLEELYLLEVGLALRRTQQARLPGIGIDVATPRARDAPRALPFRLTRAQERAWSEIRADLARPHPMNRLLQGDVGCGKTAVAYLAAVTAAADGHQSAVMAPTEILAEQHARTLRRLAAEGRGEPLRIGLLTSSVARGEGQALRRDLARGRLDLVVGTHALVQEDVRFASLALAVIDEQHRFGVLQRAALAAKAPGRRHPHVLVMTATPIPRTLALTVYGDLDVSVIDELPPGRRPAETVLLREGEGRRVVELVRGTVARGEQVYVVYPLVEESEKTDLRAASESADRIRAAFPKLRVDLVHGRLDPAARAEAMSRFERGDTHILVSTTVIEVGVDVPNATLMVVEHAERFGLAQLHQLRGRVGRGGRPGRCVLVARGGGPASEARLRAMLETTDGFRIADADLRIRGPGEFLGTRQHGVLPELRLADLVRDSRLVSVAREAALAAVRRDPSLARDPALHRAVQARWGERLALARVG